MLAPINELLFRSKNSVYNILFENKNNDFFGFWSSFDSSKFDWKKRNEMWEKIKKYNLECINSKTRWLIENSKQNKMRETAKKVIKNIENQDLIKENFSKICSCYYLKPTFIKTQPHKGCLCKKQIKKPDCDCDCHCDSVRNIEIEEILVKPKTTSTPTSIHSDCHDYRSKLVSTLLNNNNEYKNNNYTLFGIYFFGIALGLGRYYFYRMNNSNNIE